MTDYYRLDRPVAITCPECGGALRAERDGTLLQYVCHIGHVLTAETMLEAHSKQVEVKLAAALVVLNERAELCRQLGEEALLGEQIKTLAAARSEALERAEIIKQLLESEWKSPSFYDE